MRSKLNILVATVLILYLGGPLIAGLFGLGDRDGPRIYPSRYHTVLYKITYSMTHDDKPRIGWDSNESERPLFYGFARPHRLR